MQRGRGKRSRGGNGFAEWGGYMAAKKQKLEAQFSGDIQREQDNSSTSSEIFSGVTIHVNGYTVPSSDELKRLMQLHGGAYQHYYGKTKVTHIIATMLPHTKLKKLTDEKVVRPEWILDSIKAGELLSCEPYQLYSRHLNAQKTLVFTPVKTADRPDEMSLKSSTQITYDKTNYQSSLEVENVAQNQSSSVVMGEKEKTKCRQHLTSTDFVDLKTPQKIRTDHMIQEASAQLSSSSPRASTLTKSGKSIAVAGDPSFVSEFYNNSRLHHIATWGAEFKAYVNSLQTKGDTRFPGREKLMRLAGERVESDSSQDLMHESEPNPSCASMAQSSETRKKHSNRVIMHIDMDCFFVSVGLINKPDLQGKPVAVTHSRGKGMPVANKEAREYEKMYYENMVTKTKEKANLDIASLFRRDKAVCNSDVCNKNDIGESKIRQSEAERKKESKSQDKQLKDTSTNEPQECSTGDKETSRNVKDIPSTSTAMAPHVLDQTSPPMSMSPEMPTESFNSMADIASCSYEARQAGVKNGMCIGRAKKLCPDLQMIPYDFDGYKKVSKILYETVASYTHDIEAVSCDEMLVDITSVLEDTALSPLEFTGLLRKEIKEKTMCPASAGLASNILLARMSTRVAKPNGQFYLESNAVEDFIKKQPVRDLPGVGWSMGRRLQAMGLNLCEDLQKLPVGVLQKEFGPKTGQSLYQYCRGIDDRPIKVEQARKSVSAEINYGIRFKEDSEAVNFVTELAGEVHRRLQAINMRGKTIALKMKVRQAGAPKETSKFLGHGVCDNIAKSVTLATATDKLELIQNESMKLLKQVKVPASDMRGNPQAHKSSHVVTSKGLQVLPTAMAATKSAKSMNTVIGIQISRLTSLSASKSTANLTSNKSLLDFVNIGQSDETKDVNFDTKELLDSTKEKKTKFRIPTMLDFVSKQAKSEVVDDCLNRSWPSSETSNMEATDITPAKVKKLPPLPMLPEFKTPSVSGTPPAKVIKQEDKYSVPTPSQLDESVLSALPNDIRCQILDSYKSDDITHDFIHTNWSPCIDKPSTSTGDIHQTLHHVQHMDPQVLEELPADIVAEIIEARNQDPGETHMSGPIEPLPNMSQIDPSCLEALPPELQKELQIAYERQNKSTNPPKPSPKKNNQYSESLSKPSSVGSPFKINRRHRGRPHKVSPSKKAYQKPANQPGIKDVIARQIEASPSKNLQPEETTIKNEDYNKDQQRDETDTHRTEGAHKPVNLCGAVKLQDVKNLLKEWMFAFPEPLDEDVHHIIEYLYRLILDRNLEMVHFVLRALKRLGERCGTPAWIAAYSMMEGKAQNIICETYGSKLKI